MFNDIKTGTKLLYGFGLVLAVTLISGLVDRQGLVSAGDYLNDLGNSRIPSINAVQGLVAGQLHVATGQRGLINRRMMEHSLRQSNYEEVANGIRQAEDGRKEFDRLPQSVEQQRVWTRFVPRWEEWLRAVQNVVDISREKDALISAGVKLDDPRIAQVDDRTMDILNRSRELRVDCSRMLADLNRLNNEYGKAIVQQAEASSAKNIGFSMVVMLLGCVIAAVGGILIARNIKSAVGAIRQEATRLAEAAVSGHLATRANVMSVPAEFRGILQGVNDTLDAVINPLNVAADYVDKISKGNIPPKISDHYNGEFNVIKSNLNELVGTINLLIDDMANMSKQHDSGDIDVKIPEEKFEGAYRVMAKGVNDMVFGHIAVKKKAMACLSEFSRGNFDAELEKFPGKKAFINENIERLRSNIKAFVHDMGHMSKEHDAGDIDVKIPEDKFDGGYRVMAKGVNDMVFGHIAVKKKAMACLAEFAAGNFDAPLEKFPGKKVFINDNIELLRRNSKALVTDANMLSKAAVEGKLATRADASKHQGDFRKIVQGVNDTLDAVIGPLNVAADYVDKISRGNIPAKITDTYNGDFNTIKNNLNRCVDAVNSLVADTETLVKASIEGKLSTRADASKHEGDYRRIVDGVNKTLDAVIAPVMEAAGALETLARYDLRARVTGDYQGDHARIKDALNGTAKALQDALSQVADAVEQVSEASQQIAGSSQAVSQGASEQASSLEETSSSLEEMAGMTKQNADNTIQARSLAQTTKEAAEKGGTAMVRMTDAMEKIRAASQGTADIIKDINEIAFQTNLLALNAAVEAARAGDAGRGFAVVAEEVRNLALRSKEAAKKTEDLIKVAVGHAENGRIITNEVAGSLTEIVTAAAKVNDIVSEIAVASQEQSRGIEQVNTAVAEMDKVVQTAAANAEESSSAAEELASQSEELSSLVQRFELDRDNRTASRRHAPTAKEAAVPRRAAMHPATIPPPRRGAVNVNRAKKPNGSNGGAHKPSPEDLIPLEKDPEFQDF